MTGEDIATRLEQAAEREEKIFNEVSKLKTAFEELKQNGNIPDHLKVRIETAFNSLEAAQELSDEVNPDQEESTPPDDSGESTEGESGDDTEETPDEDGASEGEVISGG